MTRNWKVFLASVFFVLGFSFVFSLVGILLQTVLASVSYAVQEWLGRIGGAVIIFFGLYLLGLVRLSFLEREHKFEVKRNLGSYYLTSFIFGAAFAVGWTPCVSAALGAILALAVTRASSAFFLLLAYTLGVGIPFLVVGFFTSQAQAFIKKASRSLVYIQYFFGALLIIMGVFVFVGQLSRIANLEVLVNFLGRLNLVTGSGGSIASFTFVNLGIAFLAGLGSFLSPCILPLVPGFLSYLASSAVKEETR
ncbi:MAG: sulfite exporter TauE/SafE family protein [Candidatus Ryanbacteria bacterium]|nr:sulfite exporter TauE/SafE family protein [Candidatus Ryanbacteria bacterium]